MTAPIKETYWHKKAAEKLFDILEYHEFGELEYAQENDPRFHFNGGMWVRNQLRDLGYHDELYGNLDDHYLEILKLVFKRIGL